MIFGGYARRTNTKCQQLEEDLWLRYQIRLHLCHRRLDKLRGECRLHLLSLLLLRKCLKRYEIYHSFIKRFFLASNGQKVGLVFGNGVLNLNIDFSTIDSEMAVLQLQSIGVYFEFSDIISQSTKNFDTCLSQK